MKGADSDLEREWNHQPPRRRLRLPKAWGSAHDPMGGHLAGALMLLVGLIAIATGHWKFGVFLAGLGLLLLVLVSFVASRFGSKKPR